MSLISSILTTNCDAGRPLHRIAEVRQREGVSLRAVARRMGVSIVDVRVQENENTDLKLTNLYTWQRTLGVPAAELLCDGDETLHAPQLERARMILVMKTVAVLQRLTNGTSLEPLSQQLYCQLVDIMPELETVKPWASGGDSARPADAGRVVTNPVPDEFFQWQETITD